MVMNRLGISAGITGSRNTIDRMAAESKDAIVHWKKQIQVHMIIMA